MPTKFTLFLCPNELLTKAKIKAARDRRSLSNYIITLIEKNVADQPTPVKSKLAIKSKPTPAKAAPVVKAAAKAKAAPVAKAAPKAKVAIKAKPAARPKAAPKTKPTVKSKKR